MNVSKGKVKKDILKNFKEILLFICGLSSAPIFLLWGASTAMIDNYFETKLGEALLFPVMFAFFIFYIYIRNKNRRVRIGTNYSFVIFAIPVSVYFLLTIKGFIWLFIGLFLVGLYIAILKDVIEISKRALKHKALLKKADIKIIIISFVISLLAFSCFFTSLEILEDKFLEIKNPTILFIDILYFNVISFTTIGYGDIVPLTAMAKVLVLIENAVMFFHFALGIGLIVRGIKD